MNVVFRFILRAWSRLFSRPAPVVALPAMPKVDGIPTHRWEPGTLFFEDADGGGFPVTGGRRQYMTWLCADCGAYGERFVSTPEYEDEAGQKFITEAKHEHYLPALATRSTPCDRPDGSSFYPDLSSMTCAEIQAANVGIKPMTE